MKLTNKCKKDFEKWYILNHCPIVIDSLDDEELKQNTEERQKRFLDWWFHVLNESMQYGVLVDFFDSVDICVDVFTDSEYPDIYFDYKITEKKEGSIWGRATIAEYKTRPEARKGAIFRANEIYNECH